MNLLAVILAALTLGWDANTEPDIFGYKVHEMTPTGWREIGATSPDKTSFSTPATAGAFTVYAVTAMNTSGLESPRSNELTVCVPEELIGASHMSLIIQHSTDLQTWTDTMTVLLNTPPVRGFYRLNLDASDETITARRTLK